MFKKVLFFCVSISLLICVVTNLVQAHEKPILEILPQVEVTNKTIYLRDIAKLSGFGDIDEAISNIVLGSTAIPGSSTRFSVGQIQVKLRQAGFNPLDFHIVGASQVVVTTPKDITANNFLANSKSEIQGDNLVSQQIYEVVVPISNINRHEIISEEVLRIEVREGYSIPRDLATVDDLIDKRATRLLVAGSVLYLNSVETPPVLERNKRVTILVEINGLRVSTEGIAQQGGGIGDIISVKNQSSGQIIYAEIISSDVVKVDIGGLD